MGKEKPGTGLRLFYKASDCIYKNFRLRIQILYQFLITIGKNHNLHYVFSQTKFQKSYLLLRITSR